MWEYRARFAAPIDGDSLYVVLDLGFDVQTHQELRLVGVFAPEHNQVGGPETRQFMIDWMGKLDPALAWPLLVRTQQTKAAEPGQIRTFVRYVAGVSELAQPGRDLNADINAFLAAHPEWGHGIGWKPGQGAAVLG